jgi:hypothetical protein
MFGKAMPGGHELIRVLERLWNAQIHDLSIPKLRVFQQAPRALRQQLITLQRPNARPRLQARDRLFWIALQRIWTNWRTALEVVPPETVVGWHRTWVRRRWTRRSTPRANGRPPVAREIRALVREMATANPLWGAPRIHG